MKQNNDRPSCVERLIMNLRYIDARIDDAWYRTPLVLRIPLILLLICVGIIGFFVFCFIAPFILAFAVVSSLPYVVARTFSKAERLPQWYVGYIRFWWKPK